MATYSVEQQKIISQYRQSKNLGYVITDDEVVSIMQQEMEKTGKVYPGFENLAVSKKGNKEAKKGAQPAPPLENSNLFGTGLEKDLSKGVTLERTQKSYTPHQPTEPQTEAINFLKEITAEADAIVTERDMESGALSSLVNTWQEIFNKEYSKTTVKNEITKTKQDLIQLEKASKGEPLAYDFLGEPIHQTFEETFKSTRGVEFNEKNIQACQEKAQAYAQVKTAVEIINKTKENLSFSTKGDLTSQLNPEKSSKAIIEAFKLAGVNSKEEINKTLKDINEKYKDHPDVKKYGGDFRLAKTKQGKYVIYRTAKNGFPAEATNEELKLIAKELSTRLDKSLVTALGVEYKENATAEELSTLTHKTLEKYQKDYEDSFKKAYGKKDLKILSEEYVQKQQQGVSNIEMGLNIASMALMVVPGGAVATSGWALKGTVALKSTTTGAKVVKGLNLVDKAKKGVKIAQTLQKAQQAASPVIMTNMTLRPTELLEQLSSENGMSSDEWKSWGAGVLQNSVYMAAGMGASKLAEQGAALYKTKALVNTLKETGKSADEISAMVKANPVKFPNEIVKSFKKIDTLSKTLQVSSEVALDISSTYLVNKVMGNGNVTTQDWINSVAFAISGGVLQKQFAHLNTESKVKYIHDAFKEYGVSKEEAQNILKAMDSISEGKIRVKDTNIQNLTKHNSKIDDSEVAPFAKRLEKTPDLEDLTNPEIKEIKLENGDFDEYGNFVSDGTYVKAESANPLAKSKMYKIYKNGDLKLASNFDELIDQINLMRSGKKLDKNEISKINDLLKQNPDLSVKDFSQMISDICHLTDAYWNEGASKFFSDNIPFLQIKDFKTFKSNIDTFDKLITDLASDFKNARVVKTLKNLRTKCFTDEMVQISPEDFNRNLEFYKGLEPDLKQDIIKYDYDILFKKHDDKYFEAIKLADDFNRFVEEKGDYQNRVKCDEYSRYYPKFTDEEFAQLKKNMNLAKELIQNNTPNASQIIYNLISSADSRYTDLYNDLKSELKNNFDYSYIPVLNNYYKDRSSLKLSTAIINIFPKESIATLLSKLNDKYLQLDKNGKKELMNRIAIVEKMPQLVKDNDGLNEYSFMKFFTETKIENSEKIKEFVALAEPEFLKKINFSTISTYPIFDFEKLFTSQNLDNMIECAKLHKELPQNFIEYLNSEKSIIRNNFWSTADNLNFQYKADPNELKNRIELIKEYNNKLNPAILERIYNGMAVINKNMLDTLTQIKDPLAVNLTLYGNTLQILNQLDKDVLDKFINYVNNEKIDKDSAQNFCWHLHSIEQMDYFKALNSEELSAIPFKTIAQNFSGNLQNYNQVIKEILSKTPKRLQDLIKYEVSLGFYTDYTKIFEVSEYNNLIASLEKFSDDELKNIGAKTLVKYLSQSSRNKEFNPKNLELWRNLSENIKTKLHESAFNLLTSDKIIDIDNIIAEVENLRKQGVYDEISDIFLYDVITNSSPEMKKCLDAIISNPKFNSKNINLLIYNLQNIKNNIAKNPEISKSEEWDFIQELINEPKLDINDIYKITSPLNNDSKSRPLQKDFAKYLINRGDLNGDIISNLLGKILNSRWTKEGVNEAKIEFAKQLLDNPNIKNEDVPNLIDIIKNKKSEYTQKTIIDIMNTKKYYTSEVNSMFEAIEDDYNNYSETMVRLIRNLVIDNNFNLYNTNEILISLKFVKDENKLNKINSFINNLIKNEKVHNSEIKELTKVFSTNETLSTEILIKKINDFIDAGLDVNSITDICANAKALSIFNDDVINILKRLKDEGSNISYVVDLISNNTISVSLSDKISSLLTLGKLTTEDKTILKQQGIDIDSKLNILMREINKKYPTIETPKENITEFLNQIKNNEVNDKVIQSADFTQFGKSGIPLAYSRDKFIQNMDTIIKKHNKVTDFDFENIKIPELELSKSDVELTNQKIQELKSNHKTEEVEIIINGEKTIGTRFLGTQGGSNTAYYTQIGDKLYYIKYPDQNKLGQNIEEVLASQLYRAAGIDSPNMKYIYDKNNHIIGIAGEYIPNLSTTPKSPEQIYDGFAVDAWLANWDAPKNDNTQYRDSGVVKVDVGGSIRYRARGELKEFDNVVNELSSLIEQNYKFMSMTKSDLLNSLNHVKNISPDLIKKIVSDSPIEDSSLINTLLKRKEYIALFAEKLETLNEKDFPDILQMINTAKQMTTQEFKNDRNIAELLGYERTKTGFEGLLNTKGTENLKLTPEEKLFANELIAEIEKYTLNNKISDTANLPKETKDFLNSLIKGIPEFAAFFTKPQHDRQAYSLDVHILKVLQDSMNDPLYQKLSDKDKIVLKFSTLLHDIGKRYFQNSSDTGHAMKSAEYVYSILEKFNFTDEIKDRIIATVENHHWFKAYNLGQLSNKEIATLCRRPEDFLIYRIVAKADANNVNENFFKNVMHTNTTKEANIEFDKKMNEIEKYVQKLAEKQVVITTSKFKKIPQRITKDGRILAERSFPKEKHLLDGKEEEFEVLNLTTLDNQTNLFKYGFDNVTLEKLRLAVHMVRSKINLEIFKTLANNPINNSAQSISMISMADKSTYYGLEFGLIVDIDNANVSYAYYANANSGGKKGFNNFVSEMFEDSKYRTFVKDKFIENLADKNIKITNEEYAQITKEILSKKYPETQIRDLKINDRVFKKEDIIDAFTYSRDELINEKKMKVHGSHNEIVALNSKVKGLIAKADTLAGCPEWFLEFSKENNLPIILVGK